MALNRAKKATKTTTSRLTMVHTTWPLMFSAKATYVTMVAVQNNHTASVRHRSHQSQLQGCTGVPQQSPQKLPIVVPGFAILDRRVWCLFSFPSPEVLATKQQKRQDQSGLDPSIQGPHSTPLPNYIEIFPIVHLLMPGHHTLVTHLLEKFVVSQIH